MNTKLASASNSTVSGPSIAEKAAKNELFSFGGFHYQPEQRWLTYGPESKGSILKKTLHEFLMQLARNSPRSVSKKDLKDAKKRAFRLRNILDLCCPNGHMHIVTMKNGSYALSSDGRRSWEMKKRFQDTVSS